MSDNGATLVLDQLRSSLDGSRYSLKAIYAAVAISFGGAVVILLVIFLLWHALRDVYASQSLLSRRLKFFTSGSNKENPFDDNAYPVSDNGYKLASEAPKSDEEIKKSIHLRSCLRETWRHNESHILENHGLDATIYLRALRMIRNIFGLLTIILFTTAAPINIVFNLRRTYVTNLTHRDSLLLITPSLLYPHEMVPHVVLGWVSNAVVFAILWYNYTKVLRLRRRVLHCTNYQTDLYNRTVMITDIPRKMRSNASLTMSLSKLNHPHEAPMSVFLSQSVSKELNELIQRHSELVKKYETCVACNKELTAEQESLYIERKSKKPQAIALQKAITDLESAIAVKKNANTRNMNSYAFASFNSVRMANLAVKSLGTYKRKNVNMTDGARCLSSCGIQIAPPPEQIVWNNLNLTSTERGTKQLVVNALYGVLLLFWIVPSAFIGCFISNLSRLGSVWPAFGAAMSQHPTLFAVLQGFLSPTITTLVFAVLPLLFRRMSHLQGKITRVEREQEVLRKLYAFFFLDNFFIFTLIGVVWDIVAQVLQQTHSAKARGQQLTFHEVWVTLEVAQRIATAIVNMSSFWVMYILRGIIGLFGSSSQPLTLIKRFFGWTTGAVYRQTPRESAEAATPEPFQYAVSFLNLLFYTTVALGFTTIQPLVLPATFILFLLSVPIKKYEICQMKITKYESNGAFYPLVNDITLFAVGFGNLMLLCVVWVQAGWRIAVAAAPLAATVIIFKIVLWFKFDKPFYLIGLEQPAAEASASDILSEVGNLGYGDLNTTSLHQDIRCYNGCVHLEKPILTFGQAILYCAKCDEKKEPGSELRKDSQSFETDLKKNPFSDNLEPFDEVRSDNKSFEDMEQEPNLASEHIYPSGYTPVEPYPTYQASFGHSNTSSTNFASHH